MLQMPQRSVTRFFIPLIDVLTLLFCVFLIMPLSRTPTEEAEDLKSKTPEEQVELLRQENKRLKEESLKMQADLAALRAQKLQDLKVRLVTRILGFDFSKGQLFAMEGDDRRPLKSEAAVLDMVETEKRQTGLGEGELSYQLLVPRGGNRTLTAGQYDRILRWFAPTGVRFEIKLSPYEG
jgi:hypothetical protein